MVRKIQISFMFLAIVIILVHAIIPHHHHKSIVCLSSSDCNNEYYHHDHTKQEHHSKNSDAERNEEYVLVYHVNETYIFMPMADENSLLAEYRFVSVGELEGMTLKPLNKSFSIAERR